jgi:hypothetical protein
MPIGDTANLEPLLAAERADDRQPVSGANQTVRLRGLIIHFDLAGAARLLRFRPRLEQTCYVQPNIDADGI